MSYPVTVDQLIGSIRRRAFMPQDGDGSDTSTLLQLMNESVGWLQGQVEKERQGHYRNAIDIPLVGGQQDYPVPARSAATQLDIVVPIDSQGNPIDQMLVRDDVEWGAMYPPSQTASYPWRYFWMANAIRVYPPPAGAGYSLRMFFLQRMAQLVLQASCVQTTGYAGGNVMNVRSFTSGIAPPSGDYRPNARANSAAWTGVFKFDIVRGVPPFDVLYQDVSSASGLDNSGAVGTPTFTAGSGATFGPVVYNAVGGITNVPVTGGGSGYVNGSPVTWTFVGQPTSGSGFTATAVASGGVLSAITITNPGFAYPDGTGQGFVNAFLVTPPTADPSFSKLTGNDFLCLSDTAPVLTWTMLEAAPIFAQYCAMKLLEARKDPGAYQLAKDALGVEGSVFQSLVGGPRVRQQHNKIITGLGQFRWGARRTRPLGGYLR